jgi:hypothetical protein
VPLAGPGQSPGLASFPGFPGAGNGHEVLAARHTDPASLGFAAGIRAGERKTCCAKPPPGSPGLWVLNAAACFAGAPSGHSGGRQIGIGRDKRPSGDRYNPDLATWRAFSDVRGRFGASVVTPFGWAVRFCGVGTLIAGHDVSGIGWQNLGRAMQSITTMVPVWQCGHSRNDCPVRASKRSR